MSKSPAKSAPLATRVMPKACRPHDVNAITKAFFAAAASIPDEYREAAIKAAVAKVQAEARAQRAKAAAARAKVRAKARPAKAEPPKAEPAKVPRASARGMPVEVPLAQANGMATEHAREVTEHAREVTEHAREVTEHAREVVKVPRAEHVELPGEVKAKPARNRTPRSIPAGANGALPLSERAA